MVNVRLAPTWRHALARASLLVGMVAVVACAMYVAKGAPSPQRRVHQDEIARFAPTLGHGLFQLFGETTLVVFAAWIARRGLKVRL